MKKALIVFTVLIAGLLFAHVPTVYAADKYYESEVPEMTDDQASATFRKYTSSDPIPSRVELVVKGVYIGEATPRAEGDGFTFDVFRGCQDRRYPQFDYVSDYKAYGYAKSAVKYVFTLPGNVKVEQYNYYPFIISDLKGGYVNNETELQATCEVTPSTTPPGSSTGTSDSFLAPLFNLLSSIISKVLGSIFK